jgi:hypothetical protein
LGQALQLTSKLTVIQLAPGQGSDDLAAKEGDGFGVVLGFQLIHGVSLAPDRPYAGEVATRDVRTRSIRG